ncbi:hypothetical protein Y032_0879g2829 [Ancylostoma ceylanicum]|uniref:Uncharacterized protein n=1 Tax=Ancylostoma ceylanicum TaxID=53326 RepID=A0A016WAI4_9BILA|nr:hypothetical protein Y032_0879g2829 [Ancylostoma ceylanicum]
MNEVHILTCQVYPVSEMSFRCSFALKNMRRVAADSSTARMLTTLITLFLDQEYVGQTLEDYYCKERENVTYEGRIPDVRGILKWGMCAVAFERIGRQSMEHGVEKEEQRELKL